MKYEYKKIKADKDLVEYEVNLDFKEFSKFKELAFNELAKDVKIPGFRPGLAPRAKIEEIIGDKVLNHAIQKMLPEVAIEVLEKENMKPVSPLNYSLKKFDESEGIIYSFTFTNFPEINLPEFTGIKVTKEVKQTTDKDVEDVIKSIVKTSLPKETLEKYKKPIKKSTKVPAGAKKTDTKKTLPKKEEDFDVDLTDELIRELGYEKEKTLEDVKKSVLDKLNEIKEGQSEEKYANDIVMEAIKVAKIHDFIPKYFIESEVKATEADFMNRMEELKLNSDDFLKSQNSSIEEKRKEWEKNAIERVAIDVLLINIAMKYNMVPTHEDIHEEIDKITDPKVRASYESERGHEMIRTVLTRRNGLAKLRELVELNPKTSKTKKAK